MIHPLDNPIWASLNARWRDIAVGDAERRALRLPHGYWPLAAVPEETAETAAALAALVRPGEPLSYLTHGAFAPEGLAVERHGITQMLAETVEGPDAAFDQAPLGEADAADMLALADLTRPGPFSIDTWRLGRFIGVREGGVLVAMAGERMGAAGFGEISGVCTLPSHRGRGLAAGLMRAVGRRILARGETPFLHAHTANPGAIGLYETLGFRRRITYTHVILSRPAG